MPSQTSLRLLDLTPDLLRATAFFLNPRDRLSFALSCKHIYHQVWANFAKDDLTSRFPIEHRLEFPLQVLLDEHCQPSPLPSRDVLSDAESTGKRNKIYRMVPNRSRQQHVNVAVNSDATVVAVLPYDNRLRLLGLHHRRILCSVDVSPIFEFDVWDIHKGSRKPTARSPNAVYTDDAGLDVEVGLEFSADDTMLVISSRTRVRLYQILAGGTAIRLHKEILIDSVLERILGTVDYSCGVGGAATLSPDGRSLAWVAFTGSPAAVFATFWDVKSGRCTAFSEVTKIHPRRWSALGWARMAYTPNGQYCILVANGAKKVMRMERVHNEFVRTKLCRYFLAVFDTASNSASESSPRMRVVKPIRERCEWLELGSDVYAQSLGSSIAAILDGLRIHETRHAYNHEPVELNETRQFRQRGLMLNCVHSCPAEATYKALSFGAANSHSWFVTKQPMYSLHFSMDGKRIQVATSPHANMLQTLTRGNESELGEGSGNTEFEIREGDSRGRRRHAFKMMPWRTSFATVTGFSIGGKWLVGASLLDDDRCCVCLRNITLSEYFG